MWRIVCDAVFTRVDRLHCKDVDDPGRAPGIPAPAGTSPPQRRRNVPAGAWRRALRICQAIAQRIIAARAAARGGGSTGLASRPALSSADAALQDVEWIIALHSYRRRILMFLRFWRMSPSKLLAMFVGIICLPTGTPPDFSRFWWICPSFCWSNLYSS